MTALGPRKCHENGPFNCFILSQMSTPYLMTTEEAAYRTQRAVEAAHWSQILGPVCWLAAVVLAALAAALWLSFSQER
jgi:hypothetical protein